MGMGDEDAVDAAERQRQNLLPEVGADIYEQACLLCLHQQRAACALVLFVLAPTHLTLASDDRHATRGSCSEKMYLHGNP